MGFNRGTFPKSKFSAFGFAGAAKNCDSFPETVMVIVMLMLFKYLIYVLYEREIINLMQFLLLMFF
jgi:hypothetical protein